MKASEFLERFDRGEFQHLRKRCAKCGQTIIDGDGPLDEYKIAGRRVCSDCYYAVFGDGVEKHPICNPTKKG